MAPSKVEPVRVETYVAQGLCENGAAAKRFDGKRLACVGDGNGANRHGFEAGFGRHR